MDHLRKQRRPPAPPTRIGELVRLAGVGNTSAQAADLVSTRASVAWIATLPREQAEAILLRVVVGLDAEAAARALGKRAGAVRTAAYRGLRKLAEQLSRDPTAGLPPSDRRRHRQPSGPDVTKTLAP